MKLPRILDSLQGDKSGIPQTGFVNKNRSVLIIYDRKNSIREQLEQALLQLERDEIDSITIDVKERTWNV